jgi:hypothetical protein
MGWQDDLAGIGGTQPATKNISPSMSGNANFMDELNALGINPVAAPLPSATPSTTSVTKPAPAPAAPPQDTEWSALPSHILPSAGQFVGNIGHAIMHPIQTAQSVGDIGMGALEMLGIKGGDEHKPYAQAFGQMMADRYGGLDNLKRTVINDPVGFAADASALFGGAGLAARGVGMTGAADVAAQAARLTNPLTAAEVPLRLAGKGAAQAIGAFGTHTGPRPLEEAAAAGYEGGSKAKAFLGQLTQREPMEAAVNDLQRGIDNLTKDQKGQYAKDMQELAQKTGSRWQLPFNDIDQAVNNTRLLGGTLAQPSAAAATQATWKRISDYVGNFKALAQQDPMYATPIGFDGLKRQIGKLGDPVGSTEQSAIINQVQDAIRKTIIGQVPEYAGYMKAFESAQRIIDDLRRTFSLGYTQRGFADTQLRKLQSVLRDNVNTSYGHRAKLAEYLVDNGAPDLLARLAGQALSPMTPRGFGKLAGSIGIEIAAILGLGTSAGLGPVAVGAGLAPFMSPYLMGRTAYGLGRTARLGQYGPAAFQFGRAGEEAEQP